MRGDQVIQYTGRMIQDLVSEKAGPDSFVGHVGGDDFVIVVQPELAIAVAEEIVRRFDADSGGLYDPEDRERGSIELENRKGEIQRFPLLSISIGIASTERRTYQHYAEAVAIATEMKAFTKASPGSSWAIDRRTN